MKDIETFNKFPQGVYNELGEMLAPIAKTLSSNSDTVVGFM